MKTKNYFLLFLTIFLSLFFCAFCKKEHTKIIVSNITPVSTPNITSFTPISLQAGATVTINGENFSGITEVKVNGIPVTGFTVISAKMIIAIVSTAGSTGSITVIAPEGIATSTTNLTVSPPPSYAFMTTPGLKPSVPTPYTATSNYYINTTTGSDEYNGTSSGTAWKTLKHAINYFADGRNHGGVCVNVAPGIYKGNCDTETPNGHILLGTTDAPSGYLVFRSTTPGAAVIVQSSARKTAVKLVNSRFVIFDGFEMTGYNILNYEANGVEYYRCHHIKFLNNLIHDVGGAGIGGEFSDYFTIQGNIVYNAAGYFTSNGTNATSPISIYEPVAVDATPGFHNIFSNNISFHNSELNHNRPVHSEGHGIMCDDFSNSQKNAYGYSGSLTPTGQLCPSYDYETLIENNLCFDNGGAGICVYISNYITVRNNTVFHNGQDIMFNYTIGEINVSSGNNNKIINNIAVADPNRKTSYINFALFHFNKGSLNVGNVWENNLTFNGLIGDKSIGGNQEISGPGNIYGTDPEFISVSTGVFSPGSGGQAIGGGTAKYGVPAFDLGGNTRSASSVVIGAYAK
jgi:parallel beta-helix repeat protein